MDAEHQTTVVLLLKPTLRTISKLVLVKIHKHGTIANIVFTYQHLTKEAYL